MRILLLILILFLPFKPAEAKAYKGWLCKFWTGHVIKGDKCKKGPSDYKIYFPTPYKNEEECYAATDEIVNSPEMQKKYPHTGEPKKDWIYGCDKKWGKKKVSKEKYPLKKKDHDEFYKDYTVLLAQTTLMIMKFEPVIQDGFTCNDHYIIKKNYNADSCKRFKVEYSESAKIKKFVAAKIYPLVEFSAKQKQYKDYLSSIKTKQQLKAYFDLEDQFADAMLKFHENTKVLSTLHSRLVEDLKK